MDPQPIVSILTGTGLFEVLGQPRSSSGQVTLFGRVAKDPMAQSRWNALMRNVLIKCKEAIDFSRYYRLSTRMVKTQSGPRADMVLIWNWRVVVTDSAVPHLLEECQSIIRANQVRQQMEQSYAASQINPKQGYSIPTQKLQPELLSMVSPTSSSKIGR